MSRIMSAFSKLIFCFRIAGSFSSFVRLVVNTKRNSLDNSESNFNNTVAATYQLSFGSVPRLLTMRTFTGDIDIFYEVLWEKIYDRLPKEREKKYTIIDLGANIGITSLFFSVKYSNARIYGIEPDPDNFELLLNNMKMEISEKRFFPIHAAIAARAGLAYIHKSEKAYNTTISTNEVSELTVRTIDLSSLFSKQEISTVDLLKIDIEGMEMEIFSGNTSFLQLVNNIVIECHSPMAADRCKTVLMQHGFRLTIDDTHASLLWATKTDS
ncbi:MAG: FkbM family methyltransferase [Agriterribacter sp.]